jgi:hypothetical protein
MVNKVINTLKKHYKNNCGMGIGDFLRGSFVLLHLCKNKNVEFDLDYSQHPISKYLTKKSLDENNVNYDDVEYIHSYIDNDYLWNYIVSKNTEIVHLYTNNFVTQNITDEERCIIRDKFIPDNILQIEIENNLKELQLKKNTYSILHIRLGDKYLLNENERISDHNFNNLCDIIRNRINTNKPILLLADNTHIKERLSHIFPNFAFTIKNIVHLTHSVDNDALLNTLVDFFLVAYSNNVVSLTPYDHQSGFTQYCCEMNNIPYCCFKIDYM